MGAIRRLAGGAALRSVLDTDDPAVWLQLDVDARAEQWSWPPEISAWEQTGSDRSLLAALAAGDPIADGRTFPVPNAYGYRKRRWVAQLPRKGARPRLRLLQAL